MMQLNIKDSQTHAMVVRLAEATGKSRAAAVKDAVQARLKQVEKEQESDIARRLAELRGLTARIREHLPKPLPTQQELDDRMYDENGLPH